MKLPLFLLTTITVLLVSGTVRNPDFWQSPTHRGDILMRNHKYEEAAKTYTDPVHIAAAQYRNGDFEAAAHTYKRVPGPTGAFNEGNAWLMHGKYDDAIATYDRALALKPNWQDAQDNKSLAAARQAILTASAANREQEQTGQKDKPDDIVFDQKGSDQKGTPVELTEQSVSDEELRATWLRQVKTTPADFLKAKLAYQASKGGAK